MRCVILFRTHIWDDFTLRQYMRLPKSDSFDSVILANNTDGLCPPVEHLPFVIFTTDDLLKMGLESGPDKNMVWWNADYPLYYYSSLFPNYDYYILCEYDVFINCDLEKIIKSISREKKDIIALTSSSSLEGCIYLQSAEGVYPYENIRKTYFPFAIFSKRSIDFLYERRLVLSKHYREKKIYNWPHCELFVGTEIHASNLDVVQLTAYGKADYFSHYPPILEENIFYLREQNYIHPVLDSKRFLNSTIHYEGRPERFFNPFSTFHKTLRRYPFSFYADPLRKALLTRFYRISNSIKKSLLKKLLAPKMIKPKKGSQHV
ncbi:hypothetical protein AD948_01255 [Acetobacter senegalensis]|uniref:Uncharacterized protein n=2 Tax=Acetobacter senegalensis TaxID=446692 RepID=A0A149U7X8_9PROT|nr:hypothetical protein AD948_01255 [Acetobacter senegalensis]